MRMKYLMMAVAVVVGLTAGAGQPAAQPADARAAAEQLFDQARALMEQGDHAAACVKLEASLELDPALGTLLNLAHCYEQLGRLASAWARYRELANLAARAEQPRRVRFARKRAAALESRLPRLVVRVAAQVPGLAVTRDGAAVDSALLGTPVYVDPGDHQVTARAPGHETFSTTVRAVEAHETVVEVPALAPVAEAPQVAAQKKTARPIDLRSPARHAPPGETARVAVHDAGAPAPGRTRRILGLASGGVGLVSLVGGLGVGWSAVSTWEDAFDRGLCERETRVCSPEGQALTDTARSRSTLSTVLIGAGVGLVAAGVVVYLTAPEPAGLEAKPRAARIVPTTGPDALGLAIAGGF